MQSKTATFFHEHTLVKPPGGSTVTPWHHDQPYYCVDGQQNVSFWIPLDPVAEAISLRCIRGSHRWGDEYSPTRFNGSKLYAHAVLKSCRILMRIRMITILSAGRWSREMRSPFITGRCTARGAMRPRARGGSSPLAGSGMTPPSPIAAASPRRRSRS
jgi:hypothetical protein